MKIYILTEVNAWTELLYIQNFSTKEKAQAVMKNQVEAEMKYYGADEAHYEINDTDAYWDDDEYKDRVTLSWNITEMDV